MVPRILVIDDELSFRDSVALMLRNEGYRVVVAECGHTAVSAIAAFAFDLILVDIFMPGMDGLDTIEVMRADAPDVPIVAMSAYAYGGGPALSDIVEIAIDRGAACFLHKPFSRQELRNAVAKSLKAEALVA
jgi:CheY-like chemotaxis protein